MTTQLHRVACKPSDYKICKECESLNWYENEACVTYNCGCKDFDTSLVPSYVEDEYRFYEDEEGYSESEIDDIEIEC